AASRALPAPPDRGAARGRRAPRLLGHAPPPPRRGRLPRLVRARARVSLPGRVLGGAAPEAPRFPRVLPAEGDAAGEEARFLRGPGGDGAVRPGLRRRARPGGRAPGRRGPARGARRGLPRG